MNEDALNRLRKKQKSKNGKSEKEQQPQRHTLSPVEMFLKSQIDSLRAEKNQIDAHTKELDIVLQNLNVHVRELQGAFEQRLKDLEENVSLLIEIISPSEPEPETEPVKIDMPTEAEQPTEEPVKPIVNEPVKRRRAVEGAE